MSVVVVGAGIAGVMAARGLTDAGVEVVVYDRGRRIGGRMASRRSDDRGRAGGPDPLSRVVDTGASYFTVSDPAFAAVVSDWQARGLARPWTDTFHVFENRSLTPKSGPMRWAAPGGLRTLVEDLAAGLDIRQQTVAAIGPGRRVDGAGADGVVLAMPDPQARRLLDPAYAAELDQLDDPFEPVLALTARWPSTTWPVDGVFVSGDPILSWIADDGRRRGDGAPVLVAHSTPEFAAEHLVAPQEAAPLMVTTVRDILDLAIEPASASVHRWTFGRPAGRRSAPFFLGDALIGLCGDAWSDKPRVEAAYLSGAALGRALAARISTAPGTGPGGSPDRS